MRLTINEAAINETSRKLIGQLITTQFVQHPTAAILAILRCAASARRAASTRRATTSMAAARHRAGRWRTPIGRVGSDCALHTAIHTETTSAR